MSSGVLFIIVCLMFATLGALVSGLVVMAYGGALNQRWSNILMTTRVALQAAAIFLLALLFFFH